jgi:hypothetical protein
MPEPQEARENPAAAAAAAQVQRGLTESEEPEGLIAPEMVLVAVVVVQTEIVLQSDRIRVLRLAAMAEAAQAAVGVARVHLRSERMAETGLPIQGAAGAEAIAIPAPVLADREALVRAI